MLVCGRSARSQGPKDIPNPEPFKACGIRRAGELNRLVSLSYPGGTVAAVGVGPSHYCYHRRAITESGSIRMVHKASHHVPWRQLPPFVRRRYIRFLVYFVVGLAAIGSLMLLSPVAYPQSSFPSFVMYSTFAYPGISLLLLSLWDKRLTRRLKAVEYRLCPECGSHLTDLSGETACPECGVPCNIEQVVNAWRAFRPKIAARKQ